MNEVFFFFFFHKKKDLLSNIDKTKYGKQYWIIILWVVTHCNIMFHMLLWLGKMRLIGHKSTSNSYQVKNKVLRLLKLNIRVERITNQILGNFIDTNLTSYRTQLYRKQALWYFDFFLKNNSIKRCLSERSK